VLFATIAAGGGHVATANAMAEAVATASGGALRTSVSDIMAEHGPRDLDRRHKDSWRRLLGMPRVVRASQALMDKAPAVTRLTQDLMLSGFARDTAARLNAAAPALVVANHGWLATAFTLARRRHGLRTRVVIYATEPFDASALWSTPAAEAVLAPSAAAKESLVAVGVPHDRVLVAGYPVADRFLSAPERSLAGASLGIDDAFTCLVTLGAEGVADDAVVDTLVTLAVAGVNVVCVTGRNTALRERITSRVADAGPRLRVFGFVEDMERLLAAADVVVGKAGPASTMEALAVGRPVLATAYAGLNELAVTDFLAAHSLGGYVGGWERLPDVVARWRDSPALMAAAAQSARRLDFTAMKRGIGDYLAACADPAAFAAGTSEAGALAAGSVTAGSVSAGTDPRGAAGLLRPGALAEVTRADLLRARTAGARKARA